MKKIEIRRARVADAEAFARSHSQAEVVWGTLQIPFGSVEKWRERISVTDASVLLVAEIEGQVVGNIGIHPEAGRRRIHAASFGMSVDADFHGQGVGTALMHAMIDLADQWMHLERLELTVFADNQVAIGLYRKFGFVEEGRLRNYAWRGGAYVDALYMARLASNQGQKVPD